MTAVKKPECPQSQDALSAALLAAIAQPMDQELGDVMFGRYAAEGEGWYWELSFRQRVGMNQPAGWTDSMERRIKAIVAKYVKDEAAYGKPADDESGDQG